MEGGTVKYITDHHSYPLSSFQNLPLFQARVELTFGPQDVVRRDRTASIGTALIGGVDVDASEITASAFN
jgi:hypothetical protein